MIWQLWSLQLYVSRKTKILQNIWKVPINSLYLIRCLMFRSAATTQVGETNSWFRGLRGMNDTLLFWHLIDKKFIRSGFIYSLSGRLKPPYLLFLRTSVDFYCYPSKWSRISVRLWQWCGIFHWQSAAGKCKKPPLNQSRHDAKTKNLSLSCSGQWNKNYRSCDSWKFVFFREFADFF